MRAARRGNKRIAEVLVARGAPLDVKDKDHDSTPLGWARWGAEHGPFKTTGDFAGVIDILTRAGAT